MLKDCLSEIIYRKLISECRTGMSQQKPNSYEWTQNKITVSVYISKLKEERHNRKMRIKCS